jgi:hypothetical protein
VNDGDEDQHVFSLWGRRIRPFRGHGPNPSRQRHSSSALSQLRQNPPLLDWRLPPGPRPHPAG